MGQFTKQGAIGAWQLIPMMRVQLVSDKKKLEGGACYELTFKKSYCCDYDRFCTIHTFQIEVR